MPALHLLLWHGAWQLQCCSLLLTATAHPRPLWPHPLPLQQAALDRFETLSLGPAGPGMPGQPQDASAAAAAFPRPAGPGAEEAAGPPPPYSHSNCKPEYMRVTAQAVPNSQALKARWHLPFGAGACAQLGLAVGRVGRYTGSRPSNEC